MNKNKGLETSRDLARPGEVGTPLRLAFLDWLAGLNHRDKGSVLMVLHLPVQRLPPAVGLLSQPTGGPGILPSKPAKGLI